MIGFDWMKSLRIDASIECPGCGIAAQDTVKEPV